MGQTMARGGWASAPQACILGHAPPRYNRRLPGTATMEAERINALAGSLADLADRAGQLRRYL
jgi:hypothetical protein